MALTNAYLQTTKNLQSIINSVLVQKHQKDSQTNF